MTGLVVLPSASTEGNAKQKQLLRSEAGFTFPKKWVTGAAKQDFQVNVSANTSLLLIKTSHRRHFYHTIDYISWTL